MTKRMNRWLVLAANLVMTQVTWAQAPAGAPAGATGLCNDGTYYTATSKRGACSGHQGVKQWYGTASTSPTTSGSAASGAGAAAPSTKPPASSPNTSAAPPAQEPTQPRTAPTTRTPAAGGSLGTVWLNTATNVYHCPGSQYYGKTKAGAYMSETEARAKALARNVASLVCKFANRVPVPVR